MAANRDNEELIRALENHSVEGYPITDPIFGDAFIIRQEGTGPVAHIQDAGTELGSPEVVYLTRPAHRFPVSEWMLKRHLSAEPMDYKEWIEKYGRRTRLEVLPMTAELRDELEGGRPVSEQEAEMSLLRNSECLGPDEKTVVCNSVYAKNVWIPENKLKTGMLVEVIGPDKSGTPDFYGAGRVVGKGKSKDVVLVELFTPVSYLSSTNAIANDEIRPGFYSSKTYSIGYGIRQMMEDNDIPLPPGKFVGEKEREYVLEELIDLTVIQGYCKKYEPEAPVCLLQSMIFYILPLETSEKYAARFKPLPEKFLTSEYVVSYD